MTHQRPISFSIKQNVLNNDLEIKCKDGTILYGNRAILAARSEVFDRILFIRTSEISDKQVSFQKIEASVMKIILEYLYTGSISDGTLSTENAFETLNAADFFQLKNLQDQISEFYMKASQKEGNDNKSPELLSKAVQLMSLAANNGIIDFLVDSVARLPLDTITPDRLSFQALQCLLSKSNDENKIFVTSEYSILRIAILLSAKKVSQEAVTALEKRLPVWDKIKDGFDFKNNDISNIKDICVATADNLSPIIEFIDFRRINGKILVDIIEPLNLISSGKLLTVYRFHTYEKKHPSPFRGLKSHIKWDNNSCGPNLEISSDGCTVSRKVNPNVWNTVRTNYLMIEGIHKLRVKIENSNYTMIGICEEGINYSDYIGASLYGYCLYSEGFQYIKGSCENINSPRFGNVSSEVIVHLNMDDKTCEISVDGKENVVRWTNIPSKLYFAASLYNSGNVTIAKGN
ncbi:4519_t:CDS:2 [Acaulospora colombiana]|uniref:4519_t:CDS:1 n=1 Tax=Acaulospora colombiana TaxID=27376 RepID=A0ACA9K6V2_9GLOM|nr:4519_t:CDS:2 [Acaulospora colombiana]